MEESEDSDNSLPDVSPDDLQPGNGKFFQFNNNLLYILIKT